MKKLLSMGLCVIMACVYFVPSVSAKENDEIVDNGFVSVTDYGANGKDKNDDYAAFEAALKTGKNIYVPKGDYYLSQTVCLSDRILRGSASRKTQLIGIMTDINSPIVLMEGCSSISDITISYPTKEECLNAKQGQKVALQVGSQNQPLTEGSTIRGLYFLNSGTAIYSPANSGCIGVLFDNLEIEHFIYRGFDMQSENRLMNSYSNCYITSHHAENVETKTDCGFALEGGSFGETLHQINVEHDEYINAIRLTNAKGFNFSSIHLEGVCLRTADAGYINLENSTGHISSITTLYTRVMRKNNNLFRFGNSDLNTGDVLSVGIVQSRGLNQFDKPTHPYWQEDIVAKGYTNGLMDGSAEAPTFRIFGRSANAKGDYKVVVDCHAYFSFQTNDVHLYSIYDNAKNLSVKVKLD